MDRKIVEKAYLKLRNFLIEKNYIGVAFDFKSYDDKNDIPHITFNGERRNISYVRISGKTFLWAVLAPYWHETYIELADIDTDELYTLLQDIYYQLEESWQIGDFEEDFLNL